jgi:hypothetical protein
MLRIFLEKRGPLTPPPTRRLPKLLLLLLLLMMMMMIGRHNGLLSGIPALQQTLSALCALKSFFPSQTLDSLQNNMRESKPILQRH